MAGEFRLIMLSAMYENGGNTTHRLLDGHPQLLVYPFESQLGTQLVRDPLVSLFPAKYRWPVFDLCGDPASDYDAIIDEECKVRTKTPHVSKFRDAPMELSDPERKKHFLTHLTSGVRNRGRIVEAFFRATFDAWKDAKRSGRETVHVGYSPIVIVDALKIIQDLPESHVLHVVRNPWSAYADTKKRPVPLPLEHYMTSWTVCQYFAILHRELDPRRVHLLRYEDIIENPQATLGAFLKKVGLEPSQSLATASWNGTALENISPWGTIRIPTPKGNRETAMELDLAEREDIGRRAGPYLREFGYERFVETYPSRPPGS